MGIRVIKTALAAVSALYIANALQLEFPTSAGLLAILGLGVTKRSSLSNVTQRLLASVLGLFTGCILFLLCGFQHWVIGLFILLTYPILARAKLKEGIITSSVVVLHVYSNEKLGGEIILNEIMLLAVGLGCATFFNLLYMPKEDQKLIQLRNDVEKYFSQILTHIANHLRDADYIWDGAEWIEVDRCIKEGEQWAKKAYENSLFKEKVDWQIYFHMRSEQFDSIGRMMNIVAQIYQSLPHGEMVANVFEELSESVKVEYYTGRAEKRLEQLERKFKSMDLPSTREEFEIRSALLQLCVELNSFLTFAKKEKKRKAA